MFSNHVRFLDLEAKIVPMSLGPKGQIQSKSRKVDCTFATLAFLTPVVLST